jgi:Putative amidoligase enzyme/KTSC domain
MCQAVRDGGRRCPIHRRDTIVAMHVAKKATGFSTDVIENLFTDLRRDGRHVTVSGLNNDQYETFISNLSSNIESVGINDDYQRIFNERTQDDAPNGDTLYALRRIHGAAISMKAAFDNEIRTISHELGITPVQAKAKFEELRSGVDVSRGSAVPPQYTTRAKNIAREKDLPHDKASVVAFALLRESRAEEQTQRRITIEPLDSRGGSTAVTGGGYDPDGGRLELTFANGSTHTWRNVPESVWENIESGPRSPVYYFSNHVRGNPDYMYASDAEAEADAVAVRCGSCGQFRAVSHQCPERAVAVETEERATESETPTPNGSTDPEEEIVVPVSEESLDIVSEEVNETHEDTEDSEEQESQEDNALLGFAPPEPTAYTPTVESQSTPAALNTFPVISSFETPVGERQFYGSAYEVHAPNNVSRYYSLNEGDSAFIETITDDPDVHVVVQRQNYEYDDNGRRIQNGEIVSSYDRRYAFAVTPYNYSREETSSATIHRKGYIDPTKYTMDEQSEYLRSRGSLVDENTVRCETVMNATSRYKPEGTNEARIKWAKVNQLRAALGNGSSAVAEIQWESSLKAGIDSRGYHVPEGSFTVSGTAGVKRNSDGTISMTTSTRDLKCSCLAYRRNYHCPHVDYVHHHTANIAQQMAEVQSRGPRAEADLTTNPHRVPAAIRNRNDVRMTPPSDETDGRTQVQFLGQGRTRRYRSYRGGDIVTANDWAQAQTDPGASMNLYAMTAAEITAPAPAALRSALREGVDVTFPTTMSYNRYVNDEGTLGDRWANVRGDVTLSVDGDGNVTANTERLRCTCGRFRSEAGTCFHVQSVQDRASDMYLGERGSVYNASFNASNLYDSYQNEIRAIRYANANNIPVEEARNSMEAIIEAEREEERQRQAEAAAQAAQWAAERQAQQEARAEQRRIEMRDYVANQRARFQRDNPEFVSNLAAYKEDVQGRWSEVEEGYGSNLESLSADIAEAKDKKSHRQDYLEYKTADVTDGVCDPDIPGSRRFGVEIEFVFPSTVNKATAMRNIGRDLAAAGLTEDSSVNRYHAARSSGWAKWSLERDCSVDGELVSPILADTPEHWEQLNKAIEILKSHGAKANAQTGSHVHISTGSYQDSTAKHAELVRTFKENEDILYRAATNPARASHRGGSYCAPNTDIGNSVYTSDLSTSTDALSGQQGHYVAMNVADSGNFSTGSHVEFRVWDGTLDAAVIQQQVATSAALTEYAERKVDAEGSSIPREVSRTRGHHAMNGTDDNDQDTLEHLAAFTDKVFRRQEDRKRFVSLFSVNKWQRG